MPRGRFAAGVRGKLGLLCHWLPAFAGRCIVYIPIVAIREESRLQNKRWTWRNLAVNKRKLGEVAEWSNALVLKTSEGASLPWVRIPPSPPLTPENPFSVCSRSQIFLLFSKVIAYGLLSAFLAVWVEMVLYPPIFSKAVA